MKNKISLVSANKTRLLEFILLICFILMNIDSYSQNDTIKIDSNSFKVISYYENGILKTEVNLEYIFAVDSVWVYNVKTDLDDLTVYSGYTYFKNGSFKNWYPNGSLKEKGEFLQNRKHGKWISLYPSGSQQTIIYYNDGLLYGQYVSCFENGGYQLKGNYKENNKIGYWEEFYENGQLKTCGYYSPIKPTYYDSIWIYNPQTESEELTILSSPLQTEKTGLWKVWTKDGKLID